MPLSEQEQRLLDEMERHLLQNDADVVSAPSGDRMLSYRNLVYGAVLLLVGIGALIVGVALGRDLGAVAIIIGVVGFLAMLAGVILAATPVRRATTSAAPRSPKRAASSGAGGFMDRMNDRWDRRQEGR